MLSYIFDKTAEVQLDWHMHIFAGKMLPCTSKNERCQFRVPVISLAPPSSVGSR